MRREGRKPPSKGIIYQQIASIFISSFIVIHSIFLRSPLFTKSEIPNLRIKASDEVMVIISGNTVDDGIYLIKKRIMLKDFLDEIGIDVGNIDGLTTMIDVAGPTKLKIQRESNSIHLWKERLDGKERILLGLKLNVNEATFDELVSLPGIGPVLAGRIIDYRKTNGPFMRIEDLMNIKGIKEKRLEKLKKHLYAGR